MDPSIGRIVHYTLTQQDAERINRRRTTGESIRTRMQDAGEPRWPEGAQAHIGNMAYVDETFPLLITKVSKDLLVNGQVFLDGSDVLWVQDVKEGSGEGCWHWPPRV